MSDIVESGREFLVVALNGKVAALDAESGELRWRNDLPGGGHGEVFLAIDRRDVFVSAQGAKVFCLSYKSGKTRWATDTQAAGRASIVVEKSIVYVAKSGYVDAFDRKTGNRLFAQGLSGFGQGSCALGFAGNVAQGDDRGS
jgi:outer membrane protein assembly factor BamB